jgi:hypothetical protein
MALELQEQEKLMPIKAEQLEYRHYCDDVSWLPEGDGTYVAENNVLSLVRHIFRDRSDMDKMPVINGITALATPNEYGHDVFIDVTYAKRGYRATYAGKSGTTITNFTCYMD